MSAWEDFLKYAKGLANTPISVAGQLGSSLVQGQVSKAGVSPAVSSQLSDKPIEDFTGFTEDVAVEGAARINEKMEPVFTTLDKYVYKPTYRGLSTVALAGNMDTYQQGLNPLDSLRNAWNASADISLGQAVSDNFANYANLLPDWGALAELNKVDIDIYNKEMRDRIYMRTYDENGNRINAQGQKVEDASWLENAFRMMSGSIDFAKVLIADPFIVAGKAAKATRLAKLDVFRPEAIVKTPEWNAQQAVHGAAIKGMREERLALIDETPLLERSTIVMDQIVEGNLYGSTLIREVNNIRGEAGLDLLDPNLGEAVIAIEHQGYLKKLKSTVEGRQAKIEELNKIEEPAPNLATGVNELVDIIYSRQMTGPEIASFRLLQDYAIDVPFLANTLAEAAKRGKAAITDVLLLAGYGDPEALMRLRSQHEELVTMIDFQQGRLDRMEIEIQHALNEGDVINVERMNKKKAELSKFLAAVIKDDAYLTRITRNEDNIVMSLPGIPVSRAGKLTSFIEKYRADKALVRAGLIEGTIRPLRVGKYKASEQFNWKRVSKSPLHGVTYVAQWTGYRLGLEKPRGFIATRGLDSFEGVRDLELTMNATKYLKDDIELKRTLRKEFTDATDSIAKNVVIEKVEIAAMDKIFTANGIDGSMPLLDDAGKPRVDADGNVINLRDFLYNEFKKMRIEKMEEFIRERAFHLDSNGTKAMNPVVEAQLAYSQPIMDFDAFESFIRDHLGNRSTREAFMRNIKMQNDELILPVYAKIDTFWRAEVLLRLGYPQRNILTGGTILSMTDVGLGGMFTPSIAKNGTSQWFNNRYTHYLDWRDRLQQEIDRIELDSGAIESSADDLNKDLRNKAFGLVPAKLKAVRQFTPFSSKWSDYEKFHADFIQKLRDEREGIIQLSKEILEDPELEEAVTLYELKSPTETIARIDAQIALEEEKLMRIGESVRIKGERFGLRKIVGDEMVTVSPYDYAGVYAGSQGAAARKLMSAAGTSAFDISPLASALKEIGLEGTGKFADISPSDDMYFYHLAKIINQQLRGSKPVMMLLNGKTDEDVLGYLTSLEGRAELKALGWVYDILPSKSKAPATRIVGKPEPGEVPLENLTLEDSAKNYLDFIKVQVLDELLPTEQLKGYVSSILKMDSAGRVLKGDVTSAELRAVAGGAELNPIIGEIMKDARILGNPDLSPLRKLDKFVFEVAIRKMFSGLSVAPEDTILTHPFGNAVYNAKMDEIFGLWKANGINPDNIAVLNAETQARKWAIQETRKWMYRVVRKNGIAASIPVLAPFANAQAATFKQVGKLSYRNPDKAARVMWTWNQISTNSYQDEEGQRWFMWRIPRGWYDEKGLSSVVPDRLRSAIESQSEWKWSTPSFNLLMAGLRVPTPDVLTGQDETTTDKVGRWAQTAGSVLGIGPLVQIAANEIIKADPSIDQDIYDATGYAIPAREFLEVFASPFPSGNAIDPLLSASVKRLISLGAYAVGLEDHNNDFQRTKLLMFQNHIDRQSIGEEEKYGSNEKENYDKLWELAGKEAAWHTTLRLANNLGLAFIPTYEGPLTDATGLYRAYQTKWGIKAYEEWITDYPDLAYIAVSRTKNPSGSSQSTDAVYLRREHNDMIEEAVGSVGLSREDSLQFVQMVTNKEVGAEVLRDPRATFWQRRINDREVLNAEEGWENSKIREGWAWYMKMQEEYDTERAKYGGISEYSPSAAKANQQRRERIQKYKLENPEWYEKYSVNSSKQATVGFVRAMEIALSDEKFTNTLSKDSFWWDLEQILLIRTELINEMQRSGKATPGTENLMRLENRVAPYLRNPTTKYYWEKFLNNDNFLAE